VGIAEDPNVGWGDPNVLPLKNDLPCQAVNCCLNTSNIIRSITRINKIRRRILRIIILLLIIIITSTSTNTTTHNTNTTNQQQQQQQTKQTTTTLKQKHQHTTKYCKTN
jgi:hypothetical protein